MPDTTRSVVGSPFAVQPVGDHLADQAAINMRQVDDRDWRREVYIADGNGVTSGPLRGTYTPATPSGPTDVHGGADLDGDGVVELIVAFSGNGGRLAAIGRLGDCEIVLLTKDDGTLFEILTEAYGHNCCPYHHASLRRAYTDGGAEIITTLPYPVKADGSAFSGFDLMQQPVDGPLELSYEWSQTRWTATTCTLWGAP